MGITLAVLAVVLLWGAAVAFAQDSRDGNDWISRSNVQDRARRPGE